MDRRGIAAVAALGLYLAIAACSADGDTTGIASSGKTQILEIVDDADTVSFHAELGNPSDRRVLPELASLLRSVRRRYESHPDWRKRSGISVSVSYMPEGASARAPLADFYTSADAFRAVPLDAGDTRLLNAFDRVTWASTGGSSLLRKACSGASVPGSFCWHAFDDW